MKGDYNKKIKYIIDESGDFGFVDGSSDLYAVSFTLHESSDSIKSELEYLNEKLSRTWLWWNDTFSIFSSQTRRLFVSYPNGERRMDFDYKEKRLFQVSDMLTVIDKLDYKRKNNIPFTKAEKYFFNGKDFRHIINLLKNKRL